MARLVNYEKYMNAGKEDVELPESEIRTYVITNQLGEPTELVAGHTRVVLINPGFIPEPDYPVWGSPHQCVGLVKLIYTSGRVRVNWDNGSFLVVGADNLSVYYKHKHGVIAQDGPNQSFKMKKQTGQLPDLISEDKRVCEHKIESLWSSKTSSWVASCETEPSRAYVKKVQAHEADSIPHRRTREALEIVREVERANPDNDPMTGDEVDELLEAYEDYDRPMDEEVEPHNEDDDVFDDDDDVFHMCD